MSKPHPEEIETSHSMDTTVVIESRLQTFEARDLLPLALFNMAAELEHLGRCSLSLSAYNAGLTVVRERGPSFMLSLFEQSVSSLREKLNSFCAESKSMEHKK